ncbi:hypothetical protein PENTCL1PPCAC_24587, partial [Pristionchus entomophagus]
LVLLVLRDEVVHVALGLGELHLVHALAGVPMEEGLATEHRSELLRDSLENLLNGGRVSNERSRHLESSGRNVAHGSLDVGRDPIHEVRRVFVLHRRHLEAHLAHTHLPAEDGGYGEVAAMARVAGCHHVARAEHLLRQFSDAERVVGGASLGVEGREAGHEEVQAREWHHVDSEFAEIGVELAWESQAGRHSRHRHRHQVVEISVAWVLELEGTEADVVESLVVDAECLVRVLDQLVHGERRVVGLDDRVRDLGRGNDGEGAHDPVGVLLSDLGYEEGTHAGSGSASERVCQLESLQTVAALGLLAHDVQHLVDQLRSL